MGILENFIKFKKNDKINKLDNELIDNLYMINTKAHKI